MKKVFSVLMVILMIVGIGISVLNFTSTSLEAQPLTWKWQLRVYMSWGEECVITGDDCRKLVQAPPIL